MIDKEELKKKKNKALENLDKYLEGLIENENESVNKKAGKLSYWINDFVSYLTFEANFSPSRLISYDRGDIISVNLGYNVGSEEGGKHYAMVLDVKNDLKNPVITILPLSSFKGEKTPENIALVNKHNLFLDDELYKILSAKAYSFINKFGNQVEEYNKELGNCTLLAEANDNDLDEITKKIQRANYLIDAAEKIEGELEKMKEGSIALLGQITTVSKIRIFKPRNNNDVLYGVKLSAPTLDKISDRLTAKYFKVRK